MRPKAGNLIVNSSLMLLSMVFTLAFSEIAYRLYLIQKAGVAKDSELMEDALNYSAVDHVLTEFNLEFGYSYVANQSNNRVLVHGGVPVLCTQATINELGNTNRIRGNYEEAAVKVLVFGDSFTANTDLNGMTWPDLLQDELEAKLNQDVNVVNFGRGAYGIVQMFDLARTKIEEWEPDLVVFAFIASDLVRARFWRTVRVIDGEERDMVMAEPSEEADWERAVDATVVNSRMTREWCEEMLVTGDKKDPLLHVLNEEFMQRRKAYDERVDFYSLSTSFLFNRIAYNDPLRGFMAPSLIPRLSENSYVADARFIGNVENINQSSIPYYMIHLPTYEELKAGEYELTEQEQSLFESVQGVTGKQIIEFLDYASRQDANDPDLEELFLSPYDRHPSLLGIQFYAEVVGEILIALQEK